MPLMRKPSPGGVERTETNFQRPMAGMGDQEGPMVSDSFGNPPGSDIGGRMPVGPIADRAGLDPRDNPTLGGGSGPTLRQPGGGQATPGRPMEPSPMAGGVSPGPMPFKPMGAPSPVSLTKAPRGNLYGSMGGLQGGGLGLPLDPVSDQKSDPISSLIQMLTQRGKF
jgi:hypothetical protein